MLTKTMCSRLRKNFCSKTTNEAADRLEELERIVEHMYDAGLEAIEHVGQYNSNEREADARKMIRKAYHGNREE